MLRLFSLRSLGAVLDHQRFRKLTVCPMLGLLSLLESAKIPDRLMSTSVRDSSHGRPCDT